MRSIQESLFQELASSVQLERLKNNFERAQADQSTIQLQPKAEKDQLHVDNEALLTDKKQLDQQLVILQSKQSEQEMIHNERQLFRRNVMYMQAKKQTLDKEQKDLLVLLADHDCKIKGCKSLLIERNIQLPKSEEGKEENSDENGDEDYRDFIHDSLCVCHPSQTFTTNSYI